MGTYPDDEPNWKLVPEHIRGGLKRYLDHGIQPGGFLTAVLENNLRDAFGRADDTNRGRLHDIVSFLYWGVPGGCWGSPERVDAWIEKGGLEGDKELSLRDWRRTTMTALQRLLEAAKLAMATIAAFDKGDPDTVDGWQHDELRIAYCSLFDAVAMALAERAL